LKQIRARATFAEPGVISMNDLLSLVQQLAVRLETTQHELSVLKQQYQRQERHKTRIHRDNLLQWLNDPSVAKADQAFSDWLPAIPSFTRDRLALVFQHGFMDGMCAIIASVQDDRASLLPLCAYDEVPGTLFVYDQQQQPPNECVGGTPAWRPITHAEFERFINRMQKLLMNEFVCWQQENKERWHDPDFAEQYDANLMKVTGSGKAKGGGCSNRDMLITRMKPKVYAALKRPANAS
jgi:regulator of replication initiation timing